MADLRLVMLLSVAVTGFAAGAAAQGTDHHQPPTASEPSTVRRTPAPRDAYVYIGWPQDGGVSSANPIKIWFGTRNFGVAPAGVSVANTGHHHLLIDAPLPPMDQPIPNDRNHLHFGLGQTEAMIDLPPGRHTLQLLMGDADHVPHEPPVMSRRITIQVRGLPATEAGGSTRKQ
ncbi:MAG TPA: DUF4399 domain-containing protein [Acetobacteraceae bacterium]